MALWDEVNNKSVCECGCGEECKPWNRFKRGHHMKMKEYQENLSDQHLGVPLSEEARRNIQEGVDRTPRIITDEFRQKMSKIMLKTFQDDPTLIERWSEVQKKRWESAEARLKQSDTLLKFWDDGARQGMSDRMYEFWDSEEGKALRRRYSDINTQFRSSYPIRYYGWDWPDIRESILDRDNHICQSCGTTVNLTAHHIDGDVFNMDEHNLITVCRGCNKRASGKLERQYWVDFYTVRIKEIYSEVGLATDGIDIEKGQSSNEELVEALV
jgi:hypothetical protein